MQLHPIQQWLDSYGSYQEGISLFELHQGNPFLLRTFKAVENDHTREMLKEQLQKLVPDFPELKPSKTQFRIKSSEEHASLPTEVKALNAQKADYYKEMSYLHSLLIEYDEVEMSHGHELIVNFKNFTPEEANKAALRILELDKLINKIWDQLDHFQKHGKLLEVKPVIPQGTDKVKLYKRLTTLRTYISRNPHSPKADSWKEEYKAIEFMLS